MKTVIAAFADPQVPEQLLLELQRDQKIPNNRIRAVQAGTGATDMLSSMADRNVPSDRADLYREAVRRGAGLLIIDASDEEAPKLASYLDSRGSLDLDAAEARWRQAGWAGYQEGAPTLNAAETAREREVLQHEAIDVIEEDVKVGKREVEKERIRVRTHILERPIQEQVQLREEHIHVTREPANEPVPLSASDATFTENEFVVTASGEEAVVEKQARVVERVVVEKEAESHTETITETERRRDVEVDRVDPEQRRH